MATSIEDLRPIFIVGNPKSGTTLLQALLDGHPQLLTLPIETQYYRLYNCMFRGTGWWAYRRFRAYFTRGGYFRSLQEDRSTMGLEEARNFSHILYERFERRVQRFPRRAHSRRAFFLVLLDGLREAQKVPLEPLIGFVEKSPTHLYKIESILADFPQAKFVHVVRDPRDNYLALAKQLAVQQAGIEYTAHADIDAEDSQLIITRVKSGYHLTADYLQQDPDRHLVIKYERLVTEPEATLRRVVGHCGVDFDPVLLRVTLGGVSWSGNSSTGKRFSGIDPSRVRVWEGVQASQLKRLNAVFQHEIDAWQYGGTSSVAGPPGGTASLSRS